MRLMSASKSYMQTRNKRVCSGEISLTREPRVRHAIVQAL
jgi:hypothetical protein